MNDERARRTVPRSSFIVHRFDATEQKMNTGGMNAERGETNSSPFILHRSSF
jgi:hypothetical protein